MISSDACEIYAECTSWIHIYELSSIVYNFEVVLLVGSATATKHTHTHTLSNATPSLPLPAHTPHHTSSARSPACLRLVYTYKQRFAGRTGLRLLPYPTAWERGGSPPKKESCRGSNTEKQEGRREQHYRTKEVDGGGARQS